MSDLYTLLQIRDDIYAAYKNAHQSNKSGFKSTLDLIEQKIQEEIDSRDNQQEAMQ